ncbi:MAG: chromate resistance protein [Acidobacteria bacterium]|nr:chromate resistance protein [Acidobacteriota bacterium]
MRRDGRRWLLLIHQVPSRPAYLRVRISRRLQKVGAVALKSTVYVLPASDEAREGFQWIAQEVIRAGGEAAVCDTRFLDGIGDSEIEGMFRAARRADAQAIVAGGQALLRQPARTKKGRPSFARSVGALERRFLAARAIDFFGAPELGAAERLIAQLRAGPAAGASIPSTGTWHRADHRGRTWVTRAGIHVDRVASAWLIRRFIDSAAAFKFVDAKRYRRAAGEIRFDMYEAELTHEGSACTFEVIVDRFGVDVPGLSAVAEIVHDIDLRDERYHRPETGGVAALIAGICQDGVGDEDRLARGTVIFDGLLAAAAKPGGRKRSGPEKRRQS